MAIPSRDNTNDFNRDCRCFDHVFDFMGFRYYIELSAFIFNRLKG